MKLIKVSLSILFLVGLIYLLVPGPNSITQLPQLPNSLKSKEPGDTFQNPNNSAYFSKYYRSFVTSYYKSAFEKLNGFNNFLPSVKLNHPPEEAFQYIRDQQQSTYLEEFLYPFRDSLYVNGYEPYNQKGKPFYPGINRIIVNGKYFDTKTTLRLYHSKEQNRVIVYILMWVGILALLKLSKKAIQSK